MNSKKEEFGEGRLTEKINKNADKSAQGQLDAIMEEVNGFVAGNEQSDDIALMVIKKSTA